ncbi:hypothetical protein EYF80_067300 [Liparis tanakae]|uniref:Uncharacterized protein n=1 Tax=Liparis tanakae TaxID=230148 RepID=A0A4Z2E163_9TELE|nr:hypothetical protein EYF80_067300 [Liparis tanakae]
MESSMESSTRASAPWRALRRAPLVLQHHGELHPCFSTTESSYPEFSRNECLPPSARWIVEVWIVVRVARSV